MSPETGNKNGERSTLGDKMYQEGLQEFTMYRVNARRKRRDKFQLPEGCE